MKLKLAELERAAAVAREKLLSEFSSQGHWIGQLSSSALSTATAVCALQVLSGKQNFQPGVPTDDSLIQRGLAWLAENQNADGGWGDTVLSFSNISTSSLCWAAFGAVPGADAKYASTVQRVEAYLQGKAGGTDPDRLSEAIIKRYGKDRTFSVPILTMCAISGRLGKSKDAWRHVIPLPFEIAALPHKLFATLRMPVVSYALPALIAIGQARHVQAPSRNPLVRSIRSRVRQKTLRVLRAIQPESGGYLEATPLTSFVCMSLGVSGQENSAVAEAGARFLRDSFLPDGSWPIDTNLATWVTTLSVQALGKEAIKDLSAAQRSAVLQWLLQQQYRTVHPYTQAAPGGWAWTDLTGGVPDADDTSSALLALAELDPDCGETVAAASSGAEWLMGLQNSDGGIPTFCRGWTHLPFDQSSPDISAHAIRAWIVWKRKLSNETQTKVSKALHRATEYLCKAQQPDGSWIPLWFGNQHEPEEENRTYGTCKVLQGLISLEDPNLEKSLNAIGKGLNYLVEAQTECGGWSGGRSQIATTEETALVVETLAKIRSHSGALSSLWTNEAQSALVTGTSYLVAKVESGEWIKPSPIGFYFAKLWYYEKLYPIIFTVGALEQALEALRIPKVESLT